MDNFAIRIIDPTTQTEAVVLTRAISAQQAHAAATALYRRRHELAPTHTLHTLTLQRADHGLRPVR